MSTVKIKPEHKEIMFRNLMRLTPEQAAVMTKGEIIEWNQKMGITNFTPTPHMVLSE